MQTSNAKGQGSQEAVFIGVDIARYGGDESVAYVRIGPDVVDADYWRSSDTMQSAGRVAALAKKWGIEPGREKRGTVNVDVIGIGAGVVDRLVEEGFPVIGVNVGEAAFDSESYANKRTEIFVGLRDRFRDGSISIPPDDTLLLDQLVSLRFSYTPKGQMKLMSKEDVRKERVTSSSWKSPDRADALALAYCLAGPRWLPFSMLGEEREQ